MTPLQRKMDQSRRLNGSNAERAIEIVNRLNPKQVFIYAMGREPWLSHVMVMGYSETSPQLVESQQAHRVLPGTWRHRGHAVHPGGDLPEPSLSVLFGPLPAGGGRVLNARQALLKPLGQGFNVGLAHDLQVISRERVHRQLPR